MKHHPCGSRPTTSAPAEYFTGRVRMDPIVSPDAPSRVAAATVTFEPGARTSWHTHPAGQTIHVTAGRGLAQVWGEPAIEIRAGDTVTFPPGEKHWHGAAPDTAMSHIAIQEVVDGRAADWLEPVSDADYAG